MPSSTGLDLGQMQDYTALAIIETTSQYTGLDLRSDEYRREHDRPTALSSNQSPTSLHGALCYFCGYSGRF